MKRGLLLSCCLFIATVSVFAQTIDDMQHKSSELQAEIARLQQRIALSSDDINGQLNKYRMSQRLIDNRQELIKGLDGEITLLNTDIQKKRLFKKIQTLINLLSVTHKKDSLSPIFLFINIFLVNIYKLLSCFSIHEISVCTSVVC